MHAEFTQDFSPSEKTRHKFGTDTIKVTPVARVKKFKYESSLKGKDKILIWKRNAESKHLVGEINKLIDEFNDLNTDLSRSGQYTNNSSSQFSVSNAINRYFKKEGLDNHIQYLQQYTWETHYNVARTLERLYYIRTKEFDSFLKGLEGKKSDVILREIREFKNDKFDGWKESAQLAILKNVDFMVDQIVKKHLKTKQESRQKQLKEKLIRWQNKLGNGNKNFRRREIKEVLDHLIKILSGETTNLKDRDILILENCFSSNRCWKGSRKGKMVKKFNPFPSLDDNTNRVLIGLYGMITDRDGQDIDLAINTYLRGSDNRFPKISKKKPTKKSSQ